MLEYHAMQKGPGVTTEGTRDDSASFVAHEMSFARYEIGRAMGAARRGGFILAVAALFLLSAVVPQQGYAAPLPKSKCIKTLCKSPKTLCVRAFTGQFKNTKATCRELGGKARKLCKKEKKAILKEAKNRCTAAFKACKTCCKDPGTTSCGVAVLGDNICAGTTVTDEHCDGDDDSACPGACRADCTCPPPSTSTTTVPVASTTTTSTSGTTTTTSIPPCVEQIRDGNAIAAKESCQLAAAADPSNSLANLLAALTGLFVDALQTPTWTDLIPRFGVQQVGSAAAVCGLSVEHLAKIPPGAPTSGTVVAAARDDVISLVDNALTYLNRIPEDATIHFNPGNLPICVRLSGIGDVEIDNGEFLVGRAALNAVAAWAHLARAYDGDFDVADALNNNRSPKDVLLGNPGLFSLLSGVGTTELGLARSRLDAALGSFIAGIDFIESESDDQLDDVLVIAPSDRPVVGLVREVAARLRTALTGVATFEASVFPLLNDQRLVLSDFFNGYVSNLRPFLPRFDTAGNPEVCDFPDPRFGGLAPDMTAAELSRFLCSVCGDGILGLEEECDGASDSACPGRCTPSCTCGSGY